MLLQPSAHGQAALLPALSLAEGCVPLCCAAAGAIADTEHLRAPTLSRARTVAWQGTELVCFASLQRLPAPEVQKTKQNKRKLFWP